MSPKSIARLIASLAVGAAILLDYLDGGFHPASQEHPVSTAILLVVVEAMIAWVLLVAFEERKRRTA